MKSMTGYGKSAIETPFGMVQVELKSINSRFLELIIKNDGLPAESEEEIKQFLRQRISRGKVLVSLHLEHSHGDHPVTLSVDEPLLKSYMAVFSKVAKENDLPAISMGDLLAVPVPWLSELTKEISADDIREFILEAAGQALTALDTMRSREGNPLKEDIANRLDCLQANCESIAERQESIVQSYQQKLIERMNTLLQTIGAEPDQGRIMQEVAAYASKTDFTEEIVRFKSHVAQLRGLLESDSAVGRKMDFLIQELNRETNTIASKANDTDAIDYAIIIKTELEKIREQIQNIE